MNKHKRKGRSKKQLKYRGQGKWNFIMMIA
jgi:hypothetical protein